MPSPRNCARTASREGTLPCLADSRSARDCTITSNPRGSSSEAYKIRVLKRDFLSAPASFVSSSQSFAYPLAIIHDDLP